MITLLLVVQRVLVFRLRRWEMIGCVCGQERWSS